MHYSTSYPSPIGRLTLAGDGDNLIGLWRDGQKYHGGLALEKLAEKNDLPLFAVARKWLDRYFAAEKPSPSELPLAPIGSAFRQAVWSILCQIPSGEVVTYGDIARKIAAQLKRERMSAQAVGGAVGHNPISIIIPCHRVVGVGGNLTGYAGGLDIKKKLLALEGLDMSRFFTPTKGTAL